MEPDLDKLNFYSRVNYMKRSDKSGQSPMSIGPANNLSTLPIDHNIGYVPQYDFYADVLGNGTYWYGGEIVHEGTESTSGGGTAPGPDINAYVTEQQIIFQSRNFTSGTIASRDVFWLLYLDYGA